MVTKDLDEIFLVAMVTVKSNSQSISRADSNVVKMHCIMGFKRFTMVTKDFDEIFLVAMVTVNSNSQSISRAD